MAVKKCIILIFPSQTIEIISLPILAPFNDYSISPLIFSTV